jgi:hypothetical protein
LGIPSFPYIRKHKPISLHLPEPPESPFEEIYNKTPREILSEFYATNHLDPDGGQSSSFVKIEVTPRFYFYIPNFNARRKAVIRHDVHHILTGYETSINGESEISTWEIASGCKKYWAAFLIDISGAMLGIPFNFWGVLKAFSRGRKTKNLYHDLFTEEQFLDMKVSDLRAYLKLDFYLINTRPSFYDFILFCFFALAGCLYSLISLAFLPFVVLYTGYVMLTKSKIRAPVKDQLR